MKQYYLTLTYNAQGYGPLELHNDSLIPLSLEVMTGRVTRNGELINAMPPGEYHIIKATENNRIALWIKGGPQYMKSRYVIRPDNDSFTNGDIVLIRDDGSQLNERIGQILQKQKAIPVTIEMEVQ